VDDVALAQVHASAHAASLGVAPAQLDRSAAPIQVEELEQVDERDLRETTLDHLARFLHHRIQLGTALGQIGDALAHLVGIGVGGDRQRAPLFGAARGRLADEDESHAPRTGVGAQDLDESGGVDQLEWIRGDQYVGHFSERGLERGRAVRTDVSRVAANGARLAQAFGAFQVGVGNHDQAAHDDSLPPTA
jgi:hypothetical protein